MEHYTVKEVLEAAYEALQDLNNPNYTVSIGYSPEDGSGSIIVTPIGEARTKKF